ncbi:MAG: hypothetical protein Q7R65_03350, partial [bacterium]|nr:hypothetical protein [bacterium]
RVEVFETLSKESNGIIYILKITFSAPKLLYWNSVREVDENDKQKILSALKRALESVGVVVEIEAIENATLEAVHACKNIPLPKTIRMRAVLSELGRMDISKVVDVTETKIKNGGCVLNFWSGTIEHCFYDKVSDSLKPKNKRSDKGRIDYEKVFIEQYKLRDQEIFRYEYRLKKTQTTRNIVNALLGRKYDTKVIFNDLFTPNLLKTLVLNSWHALIERPENQISLFSTIDKLGLFLHILSEAKKCGEKAHSMNNALISYGLATAIRDHGVKEVRGAIFDLWSNSHSERLTKKIQTTADLTKGLPHSNNIGFIDAELERFEIITITLLKNGV